MAKATPKKMPMKPMPKGKVSMRGEVKKNTGMAPFKAVRPGGGK